MREVFQNFLIVCGILISISVFANFAKACSCRATETVDKELAKTPNVVILKLQSVKQNDGEAANYFLSVEKIFKGELKVSEVLIFKLDSNCFWFFSEKEIGTEFLFYLGERPANGEKWIGSICSRSGRIKSKANDISYLENEEKLRGKTRLSGQLNKLVQTLDEMQFTSSIPLTNRKVSITGNGKTFNLVTDENGFYEIYDIPVGKYRITPERLDGFLAYISSDEVNYADAEIKEKSHTEKNFTYFINNEISGKIIDRNGKPIEDICVNLISPKIKTRFILEESCTDEEGKFEITGIPAGTYKIVINSDGDVFSLRTRNPYFDTFYYPNAKTEKEAVEITIGENYFLKNLKLIPPKAAETITLSGKLFYSDGKPAINETVQFLTGKEIADSLNGIAISDFEFKTDINGSFKIKVLKGKKGILRGVFYSFLGEYKDCPEIDKILKLKGDTIQQIGTNRLELSANKDLSGIELKFPFPSCKEFEEK